MRSEGEKVEGNEHGFDHTWFCLGRFEQAKPSGYEPDGSVGTVTQDDVQYLSLIHISYRTRQTGRMPALRLSEAQAMS